MSVLYEALQKAGREADPSHSSMTIPLVSRKRVRTDVPVFVLFSCIVFLLICLAVGFSAFQSLRDDPVNVDVTLPAAQSSLREDFPNKATENGIALPPQDLSDVRDLDVKVLSDLQDQVENLPVLDQGLEKPTTDATPIVVNSDTAEDAADILMQAESSVKSQEWGAALTLYEQVLASQPKNKRALAGKIFALEQGDAADALDEIQSMLAIYPKNAQLYAAQARMMAQNSDPHAVLESWKTAAKLDPRNRDYRLGVAVTLDRLGQEEEALAWYRKTRRSNLPIEAQRRMDYLTKKRALFTEASFNDENVGE